MKKSVQKSAKVDQDPDQKLDLSYPNWDQIQNGLELGIRRGEPNLIYWALCFHYQKYVELKSALPITMLRQCIRMACLENIGIGNVHLCIDVGAMMPDNITSEKPADCCWKIAKLAAQCKTSLLVKYIYYVTTKTFVAKHGETIKTFGSVQELRSTMTEHLDTLLFNGDEFADEHLPTIGYFMIVNPSKLADKLNDAAARLRKNVNILETVNSAINLWDATKDNRWLVLALLVYLQDDAAMFDKDYCQQMFDPKFMGSQPTPVYDPKFPLPASIRDITTEQGRNAGSNEEFYKTHSIQLKNPLYKPALACEISLLNHYLQDQCYIRLGPTDKLNVRLAINQLPSSSRRHSTAADIDVQPPSATATTTTTTTSSAAATVAAPPKSVPPSVAKMAAEEEAIKRGPGRQKRAYTKRKQPVPVVDLDDEPPKDEEPAKRRKKETATTTTSSTAQKSVPPVAKLLAKAAEKQKPASKSNEKAELETLEKEITADEKTPTTEEGEIAAKSTIDTPTQHISSDRAIEVFKRIRQVYKKAEEDAFELILEIIRQ